jgi:hypothetical protein
MNRSTPLTREEKRLAYAREGKARHLAKVQKEKEWLASNPHIAAEKEREKEERRKNYETIRMLKTMTDEPPKQKKLVNKFAALMDDSGSETEEYTDNEDEKVEAKVEAKVESKVEAKRFNWADEDD